MIAVDTWAQVQCVHCVDAWLKATGAYQDTQIVALPPPALNMNIKSIQLQALLDIDLQEGESARELTCEIQSPAWDQGRAPSSVRSAVADREGLPVLAFRRRRGVSGFQDQRLPREKAQGQRREL